MQLTDFDFTLPPELIAKHPTSSRTASRLLVVDSESGQYYHRQFNQLTDYLSPGDLLVFNNTKVIPARLYGYKETGGKIELLVERVLSSDVCLAHIKSSRSPQAGAVLTLIQEYSLTGSQNYSEQKVGAPIEVEVLGREGALFKLKFKTPVLDVLDEIGHMPLPPYIDRPDESSDQDRYQTVYAERPGAVAAPTAGLHFDQALLDKLNQQGVKSAFVTLHVGAGTFQPVKAEDIEEHEMHSEWIEIDRDIGEQIAETKRSGGRVVAVGTTSVRVLESAYQFALHRPDRDHVDAVVNSEFDWSTQSLPPYQGETDIFIYPGYQFGVVDAMITNFHLPKSTLLMLVSAFSGRELMLEAYQQAVEEKYRFFSYGDAMFLTHGLKG